jgi:hypothetical protein
MALDAALHCEAGGAEPPRGAVRVVDNVRTTRPDLLLHSREPGGTRMLIEVKSIAFGMTAHANPDPAHGRHKLDPPKMPLLNLPPPRATWLAHVQHG